MMRTIFVLLFALILTACETPEQLAARERALEDADYSTCLRYGIEPRTPAFTDCMLRLRQLRAQEEAALTLRAPVYVPYERPERCYGYPPPGLPDAPIYIRCR